jgi:Ca-activated chloride channel family protein
MKHAIQTERGPNNSFMMIWPIFLMVVWAALCAGEPTVLAATTADELYREGKYEEAEKLYAVGDMDHPKDIRYRYDRGCAAYQKGDFQSATAAFASVMRRTEEKETRFRAAYNLGNAAFKQKDFASAAAHYKQALLVRPEAEDARYNLELALREMDKLEKQKKKQDQQQPSKEEGQKGDDSKGDQKEKQQDKPGEQGEKSEAEKKESSQDKQAQGQPKEKEEAKQNPTEPSDAHQPQHEETPRELSGKLAPMQQMDKESGQDEKTEPEASTAMIDRKKAEALLDNVQEDPSRFLQYQLSKEKRRGPRSGKDW